MKKQSKETVETVELRSFFVPHPRLTFQPMLADPWTGELKVPQRRVKQSFVKECDINNIIKQYSATGQITHIRANAAQGAYQDLPDSMDFQEALNTVLEGQRSFATLPSHVRERFGNDPAQFLAFLADPANQDEAIKLGLATRREAPSTDEAIKPGLATKREAPSTKEPPSSSTGDLKLDD